MSGQITTIKVQELRLSKDTEQESEVRRSRNEPTKPSYWNMFHLITIIGGTTLSLAPQLWIPRHNSIYYPDYWYEVIILIAFVDSITQTMRSILECVVFTKEKSLVKMSVGLKMFGCIFLPVAGTFLSSYIIWTLILGFRHPMPFVGIATFFATWSLIICTFWFGIMFPSELRQKNGFRDKIKTYLKYEVWWFIMTFQNDFLTFGFEAIIGPPQLLFAFLIPAAKAINKVVLIKLVSAMVGNEDDMANILMGVRLNIHYALFVAIRMDGAENLTIAGVVIVDLLLHSKMAYKIIHMNLQVSQNEERDVLKTQKEKMILELLLAELVEGLVPMVYSIGFAMAYYGPNGSLIGNVLSDIWQYKKVENVTRLFLIQIVLIGIDLISVAANTILVAKFGNADLIKQFCKVLSDYWMILTILMMHPVFVYFMMNDINLATDMTLKFEWITEQGRIKFIHNSTDLTPVEKKFLLSNISLS